MHRLAETASRARSRLLSRGVANMLLATLAFAVMNAFVKQLDRIPAMEIGCVTTIKGLCQIARSQTAKLRSCIVATLAPHLTMGKTTTIRARIEPSLKAEVESILSHLGLTVSETIHLLYRQIKLRRGLPFAVEMPNALTAKTLRESKAGKGVKGFATKKELYADLGL